MNDTTASRHRPSRILVVDDEDALTDLLSMALRYEGWQTRAEGDGASALRTAHDWRPDAVVLDVMLPDMDGLAVLGGLRRELDDSSNGLRAGCHGSNGQSSPRERWPHSESW